MNITECVCTKRKSYYLDKNKHRAIILNKHLLKNSKSIVILNDSAPNFEGK